MKTSNQYGKNKIVLGVILLCGFVTELAQAGDLVEVRIPIQVFADAGFFGRTAGSSTTATTLTPERSGAFVGTMTLFAAPQLGDHVRGLFELSSDYNATGSNTFITERAQVGYVFSDALTVWSGRFHSPYGYWNTAYHHGAQLQPSIARPVQLSGTLPAHTIGLWATGLFNLGEGKLTYDVYGGNATRAVTGSIDPNHASGDNKNKNLGFNLGYNAGGTLESLRAGVHGLTSKVAECAAVTASGDCSGTVSRSRVNMAGLYTHYDNHNVELIAEYYRFNNTNINSVANPGYKSKSSSGFIQTGYVVDAWTPFVRYEKTHYDSKDEFFSNLSNGKNYNKHIAGIRYELNANAVLKAEISRVRSRSAPALDASKELRVQYAIRF